MAYASAGDSSGGFGDLKARQCQQKIKQSPPTEMNKGFVAHRYFWKNTSNGKPISEQRVGKKHVTKHSWAKSNWGKGHQRNKLQKRWVAKIWVTKWTSCKGFVLQKSWLAKVLSCKSIELQEQPIVFRKKWNHLVFIGCYNFGSCSHILMIDSGGRVVMHSDGVFSANKKLNSWIWLCFLLRATIFDHAQDFSADSGGGVAMDLSWHFWWEN